MFGLVRGLQLHWNFNPQCEKNNEHNNDNSKMFNLNRKLNALLLMENENNNQTKDDKEATKSKSKNLNNNENVDKNDNNNNNNSNDDGHTEMRINECFRQHNACFGRTYEVFELVGGLQLH